MNTACSPMVRIPGATFLMGSENGNIDERPVHEVQLLAFEIDIRVVTNQEFQSFVDANPEWRRDRVTAEKSDRNYLNLWVDGRCPENLLGHSVVNVSQRAAAAFAAWVGKRLPTEAEWEYAAGGPSRLEFGVSSRLDSVNHVIGLDGGQPRGAVPAQLRPNEFGLHDVCGLVWEWTIDRYDADFYGRSPRQNPVNRNPNAEWSVLRGGSGHCEDAAFLRIHIRGRNVPLACNEDYGFRCARNA